MGGWENAWSDLAKKLIIFIRQETHHILNDFLQRYREKQDWFKTSFVHKAGLNGITKLFCVVYFYQILGAARTQKPAEIPFFCFQHNLLILEVF